MRTLGAFENRFNQIRMILNDRRSGCTAKLASIVSLDDFGTFASPGAALPENSRTGGVGERHRLIDLRLNTFQEYNMHDHMTITYHFTSISWLCCDCQKQMKKRRYLPM